MSEKPKTFPSGMTRDEWIAYWDGDSWKSDELTIEVVVNDDIRAAMKEITRQDTEIARLTADLAEAREAARFLLISRGREDDALARWPWLAEDAQ